MVTVRITETYDMKTTVGKLGIIGIHTPTGDLIQNLYPGLVKQFKYIRFKKCDVVGACASVLPADPLQVGVEAGAVAPEDMFNPILYKAVSNSSFDTLVSRIYDSVNTSDVVEGGSSVNAQELDITENQAFNLYYGLLAENTGRFKKSMPQTGFKMRGLYPICHTLISQYGNIKSPGTDVVTSATGTQGIPSNLSEVQSANPGLNGMLTGMMTSMVFKGKAVKMPRMPLHYTIENNAGVVPNVKIPKTFVGCLILPPARLHEFYYRMRVTWTISFEELASSLAFVKIVSASTIGADTHGQNYQFSSSESQLHNQNAIIDADNVDVNKIMEA